jgi:hypothetical protein
MASWPAFVAGMLTLADVDALLRELAQGGLVNLLRGTEAQHNAGSSRRPDAQIFEVSGPQFHRAYPLSLGRGGRG